jgi:hypothetical protein
MRTTLARYREFVVAAAVVAVLSTSAQAVPFDSALTRDATSSVQQVGLICTPVCLEHKASGYGVICVKRGTNCQMTGEPARHMPPPARSHR